MKSKIFLLAMLASTAMQAQRAVYNFNSNWQLGDKTVTLPHAWNEDEAYARPIAQFSDSIVKYTKTIEQPKLKAGDRVILEFEGARQAAEVFVNGKSVVLSEDGICAFGADVTDCLRAGSNEITVVTDNNWSYRERSTNSRYQWNDKNFNANYGGLTKNVRLHIVPAVHQTLPLYQSLGTTGQYIYAANIDVANHSADIHVESEVKNTMAKAVKRQLTVIIEDRDGKKVAQFKGDKLTIPAGQTAILTAKQNVSGLHFWSWGYGYLYNVRTIIDGDEVCTTTGFRKAEFKQGMVWLNDRVINMHGYAQRSSNEWPGVGVCVSPWLADYGNDLCVKSGGNLVRWMHICPSKQEIESCDRVGLIQAMPAGDAEADVNGTRWDQRKQVMTNSIIYNRNNPSILFYECGNKGISRDHMLEMLAIRNQFDPHGMRAIGSREMLDVEEAEYGGEMLYINKSSRKPMWMMEYCRDEGLRKYWNSWTPTNLNSSNSSKLTYHPEGYGPLYRNADASPYNHNSDEFAVELVRRWYDYWLERPGTSNFVNSGGTKIIFADTQTHGRSEMNYRVSGVVDPMRVPKDGYFAHQVMWDGWVDDLAPRTYICGHWNYDGIVDTIPVIYVVSNEGQAPLLTLNDKPVSITPEHRYQYLYAYRNVPYTAGIIKATGKQSEWKIETAGTPAALRLTAIENPQGWRADGADLALVQFEVVDAQGRRCPLDNRSVQFSLSGAAEWRGGIAQVKQWNRYELADGTPANASILDSLAAEKAKNHDGAKAGSQFLNSQESTPTQYASNNMALSTLLPVEAGVNRIMLRSLTTAGTVTLTAKAEGLPEASITLTTHDFPTENGMTLTLPSTGIKGILDRGETPLTPSFIQSGEDIVIAEVEAGSNENDAKYTIDQNERTTWTSGSNPSEAWIKFTLGESQEVNEIVMKMGDWRNKSYPIEVIADGVVINGDTENRKNNILVWKGNTPKSLTYVHIPIGGVRAKQFTIRLVGNIDEGDAFGAVKELDAKNNDKVAKGNRNLRILEAQFIRKL